ncbi:MAG: hypothetical protein M3Y59_12055 [Myxococcota bacterium]|nr:hypothetical protein [Myxococcota bacterium]
MLLSTLLAVTLVTSSIIPAAEGFSVPSAANGQRSMRLLGEGVGGGLGLLAGGSAGFAVAAAIGCATSTGADGFCVMTGLLGIIPGAAVGGSLGVQLGGFLGNGRGSFLGTVVGTAAGAGAGLLLMAGAARFSGSEANTMMVATAAGAGLMLAGGMIGYEWSHHRRTQEGSLVVLPIVAPGAGGLALSGTF